MIEKVLSLVFARVLANPLRARTGPLVALVAIWLVATESAVCDGMPWREWSDAVLVEAREKERLVLVSGASKACPWCRKMDSGTFRDESLRELIERSFIPVRINLRNLEEVPARFQSLRPPTILVLNSEGAQVFFHHGYLEAAELLEGLRQTLSGRISGSSERGRDSSIARFVATDDKDSFLMQMLKARAGDRDAREWVSERLERLEARRDPMWGGVFALSDSRSFKKYLIDQATAISIFLGGEQALGDGNYLRDAEAVARYVMRVLRKDGGLADGQDETVSSDVSPRRYFELEDRERRAKGIPEIFQRASPSTTALMVGALADLYGASGDREFLQFAEDLSRPLITQISEPGANASVSDSTSIARALLSLYSVTAERRFLSASTRALEVARRRYRQMDTSARPISEIASFVEVANLLGRYTGDEAPLSEARAVLRGLPAKAKEGEEEASLARALWEVEREPVHLVVVGSKGDPGARSLWSDAIRLVDPYLRREWWDRAEGPLPNPDVSYPKLSRSAAYLCFQRRCSLPLFTEAELRARLREVVPPL